MRSLRLLLIAPIILASATGAAAQFALDDRYPAATGTIPPPAAKPQAGPQEWSGQSGASGHPLMTAEAIVAAAANFHACLENIWPLAARRNISRSVFQLYTASLTPDLRIMDLLDNQPEFTKSFWDYLDILVTDERIRKGRAGIAIAEALDGRCNVCHMTIRLQLFQDLKKGEQMIVCESCSRMLYYNPPVAVEDLTGESAPAVQS